MAGFVGWTFLLVAIDGHCCAVLSCLAPNMAPNVIWPSRGL